MDERKREEKVGESDGQLDSEKRGVGKKRSSERTGEGESAADANAWSAVDAVIAGDAPTLVEQLVQEGDLVRDRQTKAYKDREREACKQTHNQ